MYFQEPVVVKIGGGTIISTLENEGTKPTKRGIEILLSYLRPLEKEGYRISVDEKVSFQDTTYMSRNEIVNLWCDNAESLREGCHGVVVTTGTDKGKQITWYGEIGLKNQRYPVGVTGSNKRADEFGYENDGGRNVQNTVRICAQAPLSNIGLSYFGMFFSPYSRINRLHLHTDKVSNIEFRSPLGRIEDKKYIPGRGWISLDCLDFPFYFNAGERGYVRKPIIQGYNLDKAMRNINNGKSDITTFQVAYIEARNNMINSKDEKSRQECVEKIVELARTFGIDDERLIKSWGKEKVYFDDHFSDPVGDITKIRYDEPADRDLIERACKKKAVAFQGSTSGLNLKGKYSQVELLEELMENEIPAFISPISDVLTNIMYQPKLFKHFNVMPSGYKRLDECLPLMAYLTHDANIELMKKEAEIQDIHYLSLLRRLWNGGLHFYPKQRKLYEEWTGIRTRVSLIGTQFSFKESVVLAGEDVSRPIQHIKLKTNNTLRKWIGRAKEQFCHH
jgi:hypothetical protein